MGFLDFDNLIIFNNVDVKVADIAPEIVRVTYKRFKTDELLTTLRAKNFLHVFSS
jgi:hypothetical protein